MDQKRKSKINRLGAACIASLLAIAFPAAAQLALEAGSTTGGGGLASGGDYSAVVVAGERSSASASGGSFVVVAGVQSIGDSDSLFQSNFE